MTNKSPFELLKDKEILSILDGDKDFSEEGVRIYHPKQPTAKIRRRLVLQANR